MLCRLHVCLLLVAGTTSLASAVPVPVVPPDPLPKGATARFGANIYRGPQARGLTFSADGRKLLARAANDLEFFRDDKQGLSAWDADTGKALKLDLVNPPGLDKFKDGFITIRSMLLSDRIVWLVGPHTREPTPEVIVADFEGKVINRFEVAGKPNFGLLQNHDEFASTAVAPSGRYLATTVENGRAVVAYDLETGKRVLNEKNDQKGQPQVCFPRGRDTLYLKVEGKPIRRFDPATGKELPELAGTDGTVTQVAESADGKWVVSGRRYAWMPIDGKVQPDRVKVLEVRDGATGKSVGQFDIAGAAESFAFAGAETLIVQTAAPQSPAVGAATFSRWNVATRKREWEVPGTGYGVTLSPDNKRFATAGLNRVSLYDAQTGKPVVEPSGHSGAVDWIAFAADGKTVTTAGAGEVITWATSGQRKAMVTVPELNQSMPSYLFLGRAPRGEQLVWPTRSEAKPDLATVYGWDRDKGAVGWKLDGVFFSDQYATPDGKRLVCTRYDSKLNALVTVYDGPTGMKVGEWTCERPKEVRATNFQWPRAVTGDGRYVVVGGSSPVLILNAETGKEVARVATDATNVVADQQAPALALAADASRLAVMNFKKVEVFDVKTGKSLGAHEFKSDPPAWMKFSPDGKSLVLWRQPGTRQSATVLVWKISAAGAPKALTAEPWAGSSCVAFSPDSKTLAVGYADGTTLLWDVIAK